MSGGRSVAGERSGLRQVKDSKGQTDYHHDVAADPGGTRERGTG